MSVNFFKGTIGLGDNVRAGPLLAPTWLNGPLPADYLYLAMFDSTAVAFHEYRTMQYESKEIREITLFDVPTEYHLPQRL